MPQSSVRKPRGCRVDRAVLRGSHRRGHGRTVFHAQLARGLPRNPPDDLCTHSPDGLLPRGNLALPLRCGAGQDMVTILLFAGDSRSAVRLILALAGAWFEPSVRCSSTWGLSLVHPRARWRSPKGTASRIDLGRRDLSPRARGALAPRVSGSGAGGGIRRQPVGQDDFWRCRQHRSGQRGIDTAILPS